MSVKNILVPTDFSHFGDMALDAACMMADKIGARVHIFHVIDIPKGWETLFQSFQNDEKSKSLEKAEVETKLNALVSRSGEYGCEVIAEMAHGHLLDKVEEKIHRSAIDLIVMGSHGASGKEEYFIGSNAQKMVRKMHVPILVIKNPIGDVEFKTAVFATSLLDSERKCFLRFKELIAPYGIKKIHLVAIDLEGYFHQPTRVMTEALKNFKKLVAPYEGETHFFRDYSVEAGIRHLSMEIKPDIIGISNHERRPLKRMLQGSNVEMLANHVELPLLCIDFPSSTNEID